MPKRLTNVDEAITAKPAVAVTTNTSEIDDIFILDRKGKSRAALGQASLKSRKKTKRDTSLSNQVESLPSTKTQTTKRTRVVEILDSSSSTAAKPSQQPSRVSKNRDAEDAFRDSRGVTRASCEASLSHLKKCRLVYVDLRYRASN